LTGGVAKTLRCSLGDVNFTVRSGNIVEQKCDAIVNSTDEKLDLSRGPSLCLAVCFTVSCFLCTVWNLVLFAKWMSEFNFYYAFV